MVKQHKVQRSDHDQMRILRQIRPVISRRFRYIKKISKGVPNTTRRLTFAQVAYKNFLDSFKLRDPDIIGSCFDKLSQKLFNIEDIVEIYRLNL